MGKEYKDDEIKVLVNLNLGINHVKYMKTLKNKSKYVRWMFDNDLGYQKYIKNKEDKQECE